MLSRLITRREQLLLFGVGVAIVIGAVTIWTRSPSVAKESSNVAQIPPSKASAITRIDAGSMTQSPPKQSPDQLPPPIHESSPAPAGTPTRESSPAPQAPPLAPSDSESTPNANEEPSGILVVASSGAVGRPGLHRLEKTARVQDLIDASGGLREDADASDINLAAQLIDGTTLTIPSRGGAERNGRNLVMRGAQDAASINPPQYTLSGWSASKGTGGAAELTPEQSSIQSPEENSKAPISKAPATTSSGTGASGRSGLIDLNSASQDALESLPGIGPKIAGKIIEYRSHSPFVVVEDLKNVPGIGDKRFEAISSLVTVSTNGAAQ